MISSEQLDDYANRIDAAIAGSSMDINNNGQLFAPYNRANWRTATFHLDRAQELSPVIRPHIPFQPGEPLSVTLRHLYDPHGSDDFVYWVHSRERELAHDDSGHAKNLTAVSWLHHGSDPRFYISASKTVDVTEPDFIDLSKALLHEPVSDISDLFETMSVRDALTLAVLRLREQPLEEKLTKEVGGKIAANSASMNGFQVEAVRFNFESATEPCYSLAQIALRQSFDAEAYGGTWAGYLLKEIEVRQQTGKPTTAKKSSKISLMNNPFVDSDGNVGAYADTFANEAAPEPLQHLLYADDTITSDDLDYFIRLATEPLDLNKLDVKL